MSNCTSIVYKVSLWHTSFSSFFLFVLLHKVSSCVFYCLYICWHLFAKLRKIRKARSYLTGLQNVATDMSIILISSCWSILKLQRKSTFVLQLTSKPITVTVLNIPPWQIQNRLAEQWPTFSMHFCQVMLPNSVVLKETPSVLPDREWKHPFTPPILSAHHTIRTDRKYFALLPHFV